VPYQSHRPRGREPLIYIHIYTYVYMNILKYRYHLHTCIYIYIYMYTFIKIPLRAAPYQPHRSGEHGLPCRHEREASHGTSPPRLWVCEAVRCSVLQRVAECCNVLQCVAVSVKSSHLLREVSHGTSQHRPWACVAVCCNVLQCVAACCRVLLWVAVRHARETSHMGWLLLVGCLNLQVSFAEYSLFL